MPPALWWRPGTIPCFKMSFYQIGAGRLIKAPGTPERLLEFSESDSVNIIHAANLRFNFKFVKAFFDLADPRSTWLARRITPVPPVIRPDSWFTSLACFGGWCLRFNDARACDWNSFTNVVRHPGLDEELER